MHEDRLLVLATAPPQTCRALWETVLARAGSRPIHLVVTETALRALEDLAGVERRWVFPAGLPLRPSSLRLPSLAGLADRPFAEAVFLVGPADLGSYVHVAALGRRLSPRAVALTAAGPVPADRLRMRRAHLARWTRYARRLVGRAAVAAVHLWSIGIDRRIPRRPAAGRPARPLVTIVTTTYQRAGMIRDAIDSVLAQTYARWELFVVDTGSTDETEEVVRSYGDSRIRFLQFGRTNEGAPQRNFGIRAGSGDLVANLDSDDAWLPWHLERVVDRWRRRPTAGVVYSQMAAWDGRRRPAWCAWFPRLPVFTLSEVLDGRRETFRSLLVQNFVPFGAAVVERKIFETVGGYPTSIDVLGAEDYAFWLRCACLTAFETVPEILFLYRRHPGQFSATRDYTQLYITCLRDFLSWLAGAPSDRFLPGLDPEEVRRLAAGRIRSLEAARRGEGAEI